MDIDNTKRKSYSLCPRKYFWEHIRNLRPKYGSTALRYGSTWHACMEGYYGVIRDLGWTEDAKSKAITEGALAGKKTWDAETNGKQFYEDYRSLENCLSSYIAHITHYQDDENFLTVLDVEETFRIDMGNGIFFTGKIDGLVELNETKWNMEHKTTGMAIDKQLKTLNRDPQVIGYTFAGMKKHPDIQGTLIPMHHLSSTKSRTTGLYGKPRIEFRRSPQIFTDGDIDSWLSSFMWTAELIRESTEKAFWPMQLDSCYHYGSCTFTALCEQNAHVDDTNVSNYMEVPHWNVLEA